jgi:hypothetical protein
MTIRFDYAAATTHFLKQAERAFAGDFDGSWSSKIERLSNLCEVANVRTHVAFLGTAILAKSLNAEVDLNTVKPTHARNPERSYPARTLAEKVLVPCANKIGIHLGVTGREPLNNQPYFRMRWLGDETPIHSASRPPFEFMRSLVDELQSSSSEEAEAALRAFIHVRKSYAVEYSSYSGAVTVALEDFAQTLGVFVSENSENGRRAQAVAAGLLDLVEGTEFVLSGRVNDPSRKHPGDVCVVSRDDASIFVKALEVRDKSVSMSDAYVFAGICQKHGVADVSILMVSPNQSPLDKAELTKWAKERGLGFRLFYGWGDIVEEALFWSEFAMRPAVSAAAEFIEFRLREVEVSRAGCELWQKLFYAR